MAFQMVIRQKRPRQFHQNKRNLRLLKQQFLMKPLRNLQLPKLLRIIERILSRQRKILQLLEILLLSLIRIKIIQFRRSRDQKLIQEKLMSRRKHHKRLRQFRVQLLKHNNSSSKLNRQRNHNHNIGQCSNLPQHNHNQCRLNRILKFKAIRIPANRILASTAANQDRILRIVSLILSIRAIRIILARQLIRALIPAHKLLAVRIR